MNLPSPGDYIDIHTHDARPEKHIFIIENLMAHEGRTPDDFPEQACCYGVHPWFLTEMNCDLLIDRVHAIKSFSNLVAIGEAGFDKLKGPSMEVQHRAFKEQIAISEDIQKPVVIHCVRAWDELLPVHKKFKPKMPWLIHGFRGNAELAKQLISKGMYISFWFDFIMRPHSSELLRALPSDRIFLETDGSGIDIKEIYNKVAGDLEITVGILKERIRSNFDNLFR